MVREDTNQGLGQLLTIEFLSQNVVICYMVYMCNAHIRKLCAIKNS
jgi:hypothetical protein